MGAPLPGPGGKYTVIRYTFPDGITSEFTHSADCIQPVEAWVKAHQEMGAKHGVKVDSYESNFPVDRSTSEGRVF